MPPLFVVTAFHLRLEEASEFPLDGPPDAIALAVPALDDVFAVREYVGVDPDTLINDKPRHCLGRIVLLRLCPLDVPPKALTAPVGVFGESSSAYRQTGRVLLPIQLFLTYHIR